MWSAALCGQSGCLLLGSGGWRPLRARLVGRGRAGGEWAWRVVLGKHHPVRLDHGKGQVCGGQTHHQRAGPFLCEVWCGCRGSPPRLLLHRGDSGPAGRAGEDKRGTLRQGSGAQCCTDKIGQGAGRKGPWQQGCCWPGLAAQLRAKPVTEGLLLASPALVPHM